MVNSGNQLTVQITQPREEVMRIDKMIAQRKINALFSQLIL